MERNELIAQSYVYFNLPRPPRNCVTDELIFLPATFADESYGDNPNLPGAMVMAQFPHDAEMTWHAALLGQLRTTEVKYAEFRRKRASLPRPLEARVLRGMRQAAIGIVDDREHMTNAQSVVENRFKKRLKDVDGRARAKLERVIAHVAGAYVLAESPLGRVAGFLGELDIAEIVRKQGNRRNIDTLAVRSVGVFLELVDPAVSDAREQLGDSRPFPADEHPDAALFRQSSKISRVFDEGNRKVTDTIRQVREQVEWHLQNDVEEPSVVGVTTEISSKVSPHVGASDLASGYARDLYESSDGKRRVADAFNLVVLNGTVLRP